MQRAEVKEQALDTSHRRGSSFRGQSKAAMLAMADDEPRRSSSAGTCCTEGGSGCRLHWVLNLASAGSPLYVEYGILQTSTRLTERRLL